jgi:hypothetical protein
MSTTTALMRGFPSITYFIKFISVLNLPEGAIIQANFKTFWERFENT